MRFSYLFLLFTTHLFSYFLLFFNFSDNILIFRFYFFLVQNKIIWSFLTFLFIWMSLNHRKFIFSNDNIVQYFHLTLVWIIIEIRLIWLIGVKIIWIKEILIWMKHFLAELCWFWDLRFYYYYIKFLSWVVTTNYIERT